MSGKTHLQRCCAVLAFLAVGGSAMLSCSALIGEGDHYLRVDDADSGGGSKAVVLAHTDGAPRVLYTDLHNVYWIREATDSAPGAILSVPRVGGPVSVVAGDLQKPSGMRVDADYVYFTSDRVGPDGGAPGVYRVAKIAGVPVLVDRDDYGFGWLSIHSSYLYTEGALPDGSAVVRRSDKLGTAPRTQCVAGHSVGRVPVMSAGASGVFYFDAGRSAIMVTTGNCNATEAVFAADQSDVRSTTFGGGFLYWANGERLFRQPTTGAGSPELVARGHAVLYGIDAGSRGIFLTSGVAGTVQLLRPTLSVQTLATRQAEPGWITAASDAVFWSNQASGDIMKYPL